MGGAPGPNASPVSAHRPTTFAIRTSGRSSIDLQARSELREGTLVVSSRGQRASGRRPHRAPMLRRWNGAIGRGVLEQRPEFRMEDRVDAVGSSLPPGSVEAAETEGPLSVRDSGGGVVELSDDLGGVGGALLLIHRGKRWRLPECATMPTGCRPAPNARGPRSSRRPGAGKGS